MAIIKPFQALRPPKHLAERVAALPYDVMNVEEARQMASGEPDSFLHISRAEIDLPAEIDPHDDSVYARGKQNLDDFIQRGVLIKDSAEHYYVYRQRMGNIVQTGLVVCTSVDDYQSGVIKKHEHTRPDKEDDRVKHIDMLDANDEPVFYISPYNMEIEKAINGIITAIPEYDFTTSDGVSHTLWLANDPLTIATLTELFAAFPRLYVADGHHRSAAAQRVRELRKNSNPQHTGQEEYNYFLTVVFPENQLNIMPYNRVVKDLRGLGIAEFINRLGSMFEITPAKDQVIPKSRHQFGMYLDKHWYNLHLRPGIVDENDTVSRLDVSILQDHVLNPILGIHNPRTDNRIHFVGGIRGNQELVKLVDSTEYAVAFSLHPTSINELIELANQDKIMPPKSTWFEPKLRSGLFLHTLS